MESPPMIYKSNALIEASYRLSIQEQRIVLACIAQVRRDEPVTDEVMYSVSAIQLARMSDVPIESSYTQLKEAALRLKHRDVRLKTLPNGGGKIESKRVRITGWVQTIDYIEGEGRVELRFTKDILPYLTELSKQFTRYAYLDVAKMDSPYGVRLYELLVQWGAAGVREIGVDNLREWLVLEDRYPSIKDLKKWVIEPAVKQVNEHSPLQVTWDQRKTGRSVTHLIFTYSQKTEAKASQTKAATAGIERPRPISSSELSRLAYPGESTEAALRRLNVVLI